MSRPVVLRRALASHTVVPAGDLEICTVLELVAGVGGDVHAVDCRVRPAGVAADLASRRGLHRTGWRVAEAWASHYDGDAVRAAVEVGATVSMTRRDPT